MWFNDTFPKLIFSKHLQHRVTFISQNYCIWMRQIIIEARDPWNLQLGEHLTPSLLDSLLHSARVHSALLRADPPSPSSPTDRPHPPRAVPQPPYITDTSSGGWVMPPSGAQSSASYSPPIPRSRFSVCEVCVDTRRCFRYIYQDLSEVCRSKICWPWLPYLRPQVFQCLGED